MTVTRWQPTRCGLLNLYRYDDEVFRFAGGRLLLRGNNGCGKTRVLALTLPFLFDGVVAPARVEPDGDRNRRFEWHLLLDRYHERTGYTWLEFERTDADGATVVCTIGCGLRALAGHQGLRGKWYFVTTQRVGPDFPLKRDDGTPWNREQCKEALEDRGMLYDTAEAYRHAVDEALFGLGAHRYRSLVDLLIELRRPQLSRTLDEQRLTAALADALPPIDPAVVADVAENFQALEADREELRAARAAYEAVTAFAQVYRDYLAVRARLLVDAARGEHARYEEAQRRRGAAAERIEAARARIVAIAAEQRRLRDERQAARGEEAALRASDTMRSAESLSRLRDECEAASVRAQADEAAAGQAAAEVAAWEQRLTRSAEGLAADQQRAATAGDAVRAAARPLGCEVPGGEPDAAGWDRLQADAEALRAAARLLHEDARRIAAAGERETLAVGQRTAAEAARDTAQTTAEEADTACADALAAHREALEGHLASDPGLALDHDRLREDLAHWLRDPREADPLAAALEGAARSLFRDLAAEEGRQALAREAIVSERGTLEAEAERLRAGVDPEPALPAWRCAREGERPGAALWACCDFAADLAPEARAGLEAALEAAQVLDAWITPDGALVDPATGDLLLGADAAPVQDRASALGAWLRPSDEAPVDAAVIERVLAAVGGGAGAAPVWVDTAGRWGAGSLRGRAAKPAAVHLGAATRAAERTRRLGEIAARLLHLAEAEADIDRTLDSLAERRAAVQAWCDAAPDAETPRAAWREREDAARQLQERRHQLAAAQELCGRRQREREEAEAALRERAADCALSAWLDDLDGLDEALHGYYGALADWRRIAEALGGARERHAQVAADVAACRDRAERQRVRAEESRDAAITREQERAVLEENQGAAVEALLAKLDDLRRRQEAQEAEERHLRDEELARNRDEAEADGQRKEAERVLAGATERRAQALGALRAVCERELLAGLGERWRAPLAEDASDTQVVQLARDLAKAFADTACDERAVSAVGTRIGEANQVLQTALSIHDHRVHIEDVHGIWQLRVPYMGGECDIAQLTVRLADDIDQRRHLLTAREREVIENFLIDEACEQLHRLLHEAETWVADVNRELAERPMSTGLALRFRRVVAADAPAGCAEACDRLLRPAHAWSPDDRDALNDFLQRGIEAAREALPGHGWQEQLALALDYRRWHQIGIERRQDGRWTRLTRRSHGTGSGGEKSIALTVPQFAAAAAHYRASPGAPRLIMLDEAFVGIDADMRRKCMGLLAAFDLDVVMTSEREWGCYDTVPRLAIYQIAASPGGDCVATTRYEWNGRERLREEDA